MPDRHLPNAFTELLLSPDPGLFERRYRYDITPVSDNRPFFFYTVQPRDVWTFFRFASQDPADYKINRAVPLLFGLVGVSLLATLLTLALPPLLLRSRLPRVRGLRRFLLYFVAIGAGYIMIEVALIQKFVLLLGHPTYALTVVIFSLLVSSGIGSASSGRLRWSGRAPLGASLLVALMTPALGPLIGAAAGWPLGLKAALTVLLIFPVGFLMGMPFPNGLRTLEARHKPAVRWAWSLNAAASVLGSAGAILGALNAGLAQTMLTGAALYLAAGFMLQSPRWLPLLQRIPNERSDARPKL
ncbi:MAG: hypothetical protein HYR60_26055 [Acidobacteria bacterium]|nr:hypothetical protein [Acidobacteriota bacterium]